jgi:cyclase
LAHYLVVIGTLANRLLLKEAVMRSRFYLAVRRVAIAAIGLSSVLWHVVTLAADTFSATPLADNIQLVTGPSGNTLVAIDTDGVILIEGVPAQYAKEYLAFVGKLTGGSKIKALVNTHWHDESAGLNGAAIASGAQVIAHANTKQWLGSTIRKRGDTIIHKPVPKAQLPNKVFHDKLSLPFRDGSIELGYTLQAHTDGDVYAYFPKQNLLFTGPAVRTDTWNGVDESTNGWMGGLVDSYDMLSPLVNDATKVIPLSGNVLDKTGFVAHVALHKNMMKEMVTLLRQSRSAEETVMANPAVGLKPEWGDPAKYLDEGFRSFYGHLRETRHVGVMP